MASASKQAAPEPSSQDAGPFTSYYNELKLPTKWFGRASAYDLAVALMACMEELEAKDAPFEQHVVECLKSSGLKTVLQKFVKLIDDHYVADDDGHAKGVASLFTEGPNFKAEGLNGAQLRNVKAALLAQGFMNRMDYAGSKLFGTRKSEYWTAEKASYKNLVTQGLVDFAAKILTICEAAQFFEQNLNDAYSSAVVQQRKDRPHQPYQQKQRVKVFVDRTSNAPAAAPAAAPVAGAAAAAAAGAGAGAGADGKSVPAGADGKDAAAAKENTVVAAEKWHAVNHQKVYTRVTLSDGSVVRATQNPHTGKWELNLPFY